MIISCPSCATRYSVANTKFSAGSLALSCKCCGHRWIERDAIDVVDVSPQPVPALVEQGFEADREVKRLVEAALVAKAQYVQQRRQKLRQWGAWGILAACVAVPLTAAAAFPTTVVRMAPVTIQAYEKAGYDINIYGLDIRRIEQQHAIIDGASVLTIKGEVTNSSKEPQKMPSLLFSLRDGLNAQVYKWTLDTQSRPLRPGESSSFTTRVASPPETAENLEIRFAHADELGLTPAP